MRVQVSGLLLTPRPLTATVWEPLLRDNAVGREEHWGAWQMGFSSAGVLCSHRMAEVGKDPEVSWSDLLLWAELAASSSEPCPAEFCKSPKMKVPSPLSVLFWDCTIISYQMGPRASLVTACGLLSSQDLCNPQQQHKVQFDMTRNSPDAQTKKRNPKPPFWSLSLHEEEFWLTPNIFGYSISLQIC